MKKNMHITAIFVLFSTQSFLMLRGGDIETGKTASQGKNWNFELYNKSGGDIWIALRVPDSLFDVIKKTHIPAQGKLRAVIKTGKEYIIDIWKQEPRFLSVGNIIKRLIIGGKRKAFLTFDANDILRPQTGTLLGISGKTDSGLSLKDNLSPIAIQPVKYK